MSDLVTRLRATHHTAPASEDWQLCCEAADEIDRLQAIVDKLDKTADGVPVVRCVDSVWVKQADEWRECRLSPLGGAIGADVSECYSSLAAAEGSEGC